MTSGDAFLDLVSVGEHRPSSVLLVRVDVDQELRGGSWQAGPMPILQPQNATTLARKQSQTTDKAARSSLVAAQQAKVLYGGADYDRVHMIGGAHGVLGLEVFHDLGATGARAPFGLLAVHACVPDSSDPLAEHLAWLSRAVRVRSSASFWSEIQAMVGAHVTVPDGDTARSVSFVNPSETTLDLDQVLAVAYALVSATPPERLADATTRSRGHTLTIARPDWSALVRRDGAAFVAHQVNAEAFAESLRMLAHSVHVDALMLAMTQRHMIDASGSSAVNVPLDRADELLLLERSHFEFKRKYWRTSLTQKRTAPPDIVLRQFQEELLTNQDVEEVEQRVADGARLSVSIRSKQQQEAQDRQQEAQDRLNNMVQTVSVVVGAMGLSFTAAPLIRPPSWSLFLIALIVGVITMTLAFVVLRMLGRRARNGKTETGAGASESVES